MSMVRVWTGLTRNETRITPDPLDPFESYADQLVLAGPEFKIGP